MHVYDFDHTIYPGDSTLDFYLFCLRRRPRLLLCIARQMLAIAAYCLGLRDKTACKQAALCFLARLPDACAEAEAFWQSRLGRIRPWYLAQRKPDDLVISASPEFLLAPACRMLGIQPPIASRVDPQTGAFLGENCYGEEKASRYRQQYGDTAIDSFTSDSLSDAPLARLSPRSYLVKNGERVPWPHESAEQEKLFQTAEFCRFFLVGILNTVSGVVFAFLFSLLLPVQAAFIAGYAASLSLSYLLNSTFTFRERLSVGKYGKFCLSYLPNFLIQNVCVFVVYSMLGLPKGAAYVLAAAIGMPVTFLMQKCFTFRKKR